MTDNFKKFLASIIIMSDNEYDRSDLASLGKTLKAAERLATKSVLSRVVDDDKDCDIKEVENSI